MKLISLSILSISLFLFSNILNAQEIVFEQDVEDQLNDQNNGPYTGTQTFFNFGYGVVLPVDENDSLKLNYGDAIRYGGLVLTNINKHFSAGYNFDFYYMGYNIEQDSSRNLLSLGKENDKQKIRLYKIDLAPVIRIKYGKSGNSVGKYIDLGAYGSVNFGFTERLSNDVDPKLNNGAKKIDIKRSKLKYMNRYDYGLYAQMGFKAVTIWGRYRLSDVFQTDESINNNRLILSPPPLTIGLGFTVWTTE